MEPHGRVVDTPTLAQILDCSRYTVHRLARSGAIPAMRLGVDYRFDVDRVLAALEERVAKPNGRASAPRAPIVEPDLDALPKRRGQRSTTPRNKVRRTARRS
jgi:excisionase family DNA binding protein